MDNNVKTICTIGPVSEKEDVFEKLIQNGMDTVRLNFSHATYDQFLRIKVLIIKLNKKYDKNVKLMMDLQGPRMRVGELPKEGLDLKDEQHVIFSTDPSHKSAIYINDPYLHQDIKPKHPIYLANGDIELMVEKTVGSEIHAVVLRGGILYSRKGVNVPETNLTTRGLTEKDRKDVEFAVKNGVDQIALSFVKDENDIVVLRDLIHNPAVEIISKIEIKQALHNLDGIIDASDLIMVARGDLGIEIPLEELPIIQKEIIRNTNKRNKPSIVATQMLMSMVNHHRPTRAEVSDVANAVFDGAEYLMLSDETAFGKFPVHALSYLKRTIQKAYEYKRDNPHVDL